MCIHPLPLTAFVYSAVPYCRVHWYSIFISSQARLEATINTLWREVHFRLSTYAYLLTADWQQCPISVRHTAWSWLQKGEEGAVVISLLCCAWVIPVVKKRGQKNTSKTFSNSILSVIIPVMLISDSCV